MVRSIVLVMIVGITASTLELVVYGMTLISSQMKCAVSAVGGRYHTRNSALLVPNPSRTVSVKFALTESTATQTATVCVMTVGQANTLSTQVQNLVRPALLVALVITTQQELASPAP